MVLLVSAPRCLCEWSLQTLGLDQLVVVHTEQCMVVIAVVVGVVGVVIVKSSNSFASVVHSGGCTSEVPRQINVVLKADHTGPVAWELEEEVPSGIQMESWLVVVERCSLVGVRKERHIGFVVGHLMVGTGSDHRC
jgi:hypothetical protein